VGILQAHAELCHVYRENLSPAKPQPAKFSGDIGYNSLTMLRYFTAGESHGEALVAFISGLPAGLKVDQAFLDRELWRRQQGYGRGGRMKIEIIHKNAPNIDPETAFNNGNGQGLEDLTLPTVRNIGFNVNLKF